LEKKCFGETKFHPEKKTKPFIVEGYGSLNADKPRYFLDNLTAYDSDEFQAGMRAIIPELTLVLLSCLITTLIFSKVYIIGLTI